MSSDPFELGKRSDQRANDKAASGSAIAGAGAVTAGTGLVGGGIPGYKSNSDTIKDVRQGNWKKRTGAALSSGRGGIFGYRIDAHQGALNRFRAEEAKHKNSKIGRSDSFLRGRGSGKIKPEVDIIRHLKVGRAASHAALAGGTAAAAYGVKRAKDQKVAKSERDAARYHGALAGGGGAAAALSIGGEKVLNRQAGKWADREAHSLRQAAKIVPNMKPSVSDNEVTRNPRILAGKSKAQAEAAGRWRGEATQQRYFSRVYGGTAKVARKIRNPALATAAVGAGGLAMARKKDEVKKMANDPFEISKTSDNFKALVWNEDALGHPGAKRNRQILRRKRLKGQLAGMAAGAGVGAAGGAAVKGKTGALVGGTGGLLTGQMAGDVVGAKRAMRHPDYKKKSDLVEKSDPFEVAKAFGFGSAMKAGAKSFKTGAKSLGAEMKHQGGGSMARGIGNNVKIGSKQGFAGAKAHVGRNKRAYQIGGAAAGAGAVGGGAYGLSKAYSPSMGGQLGAYGNMGAARVLGNSFSRKGKQGLAMRARAVEQKAGRRAGMGQTVGQRTIDLRGKAPVKKADTVSAFGVDHG